MNSTQLFRFKWEISANILIQSGPKKDPTSLTEWRLLTAVILSPKYIFAGKEPLELAS